MDIFSIGLPLLRVNKENKAPAEIHGVHDARKSRRPEEFTNYNVGIACGNGLVVVDVDPRNGGFETLAALESLHGKLPETWTVDTANRGRHYYFAGDIKSTSINGIDIQGAGKYVVAPPSKYQYGEYVWISDCAPWECELAPLPAWLKTLRKDTRVGASIGDGQVWDGDWKKVEDLIKYLTPVLKYDAWLKVGMALHWTNDERAYETFVKFSRGDYYVKADRYENFSEDVCHQKWKSFNGKGGITIGTLFDWCYTERAVWEAENYQPEEHQAEEQEEETEFLNFHELPKFNSPLIAQLISEIKRSAFVDVDEFAYGTAFSVMSAITQRGFYLDFHNGKTSTYSLILGPPACGKESYLSAITKLVSDVSQKLFCGDPRSDQALKQIIADYPSRVVALDEFPDRLANAFKKSNQESIEYKLAIIYKELWSVKRIMPASVVKQTNNKNSNKNIPAVEWPTLSLFGAGTYDKFVECLNSSEFLDGGLLSRLDLWVIKQREGTDNENDFNFSEDLKKKLCALFAAGCGSSGVLNVNSESGDKLPNRKIKMHLTEKGKNAYKAFKHQCLVSIDAADPKIRSIYDRASEKALRYGMMIALGRGSFDVEQEDVEAGAAIARHLVVNAKILLNLVGDTEHSKVFKRVCEDLYKLCTKFNESTSFQKRQMFSYSRTYTRKMKASERVQFWTELKSLELVALEGGRGQIISIEALDKFISKL